MDTYDNTDGERPALSDEQLKAMWKDALPKIKGKKKIIITSTPKGMSSNLDILYKKFTEEE